MIEEGEISGYHNGKHEYDCLVECCTVYFGRNLLTALIMDAVSISETSIKFLPSYKAQHPTRQ
jgi:hypothetical protein